MKNAAAPRLALGFTLSLALGVPLAASQPVLATSPQPDPDLARSLGANEQGMRGYVLVLLKTGPKRVADGPERKAMFAGHFANIEKLAKEKKLAVAGPLDGVNGLRGIFVLATTDLDEARALVAADPVIAQGEMVAEYHKFFSSAALMAVPDIHRRISPKP